MDPMVRLDNKSSSPFIFTLYHEEFCANGGKCGCNHRIFTHPVQQRDGTTKVVREAKYVPQSVTVPPRGNVSGLSDAVLKLSQVAAALKPGGSLRAIEIPTEAAPSPAAAPQASAEKAEADAPEEAEAPSGQRSRKSRRTSKSRS